uniref:Uncharacterized protein n=1 Tax=Cucumis melo TaxID=3656 RepID=A0A9I9E3R1_CUCME
MMRLNKFEDRDAACTNLRMIVRMETTTIVLSTTPHGDDDDCSIDY